MPRFLRLPYWIGLAALVLLLCLAVRDRGSRPKLIGSPAPDFTVQDSNHTVSLHDFRGKVVVLNFWATWCPPCIEEMPSLIQMQRQLGNKVTVLAVSADADAGDYQRFIRDRNVQLLTVQDSSQKSNTLYGTFKFPETYIIDEHGIIRRKFVGPVEWMKPEILGYLTKLHDQS